jgi:CRP/FNR family cyclic AMP-dependent transcriptional regulator
MKKVLFLFGELSDLDVDWLIKNGSPKGIAAGDILIQQGQPSEALYIVLDGTFTVSAAGATEPLNSLGAGEVVGEMSFIDSRPPSTTVQAATVSRVFCIPRDSLARRLKQDTGFAARFYRALAMFLSHRLRQLTLRMSHQDRGLGGADAPDELDGQVLDGVYLAGQRFQRVLQALSR